METNNSLPNDAPCQYLLNSTESTDSNAISMYRNAEKVACIQIKWYSDHIRSRRIGAKVTRWSASIMLLLGTAVPLLQILGAETLKPYASAGYLFLAGAGGAVLADKLFGFSSGWMRYVSTKLKLQALLSEFQIDCLCVLTGYTDGNHRDREYQLLERTRRFQSEIWYEIQSETLRWIGDYQSSLAIIEQQISTARESNKTGSLRISINGADRLDNGRGRIVVDGFEHSMTDSDSVVIHGLTASSHVIRIDGTQSNKPISVMESVTINPDTENSVTLSIPKL